MRDMSGAPYHPIMHYTPALYTQPEDAGALYGGSVRVGGNNGSTGADTHL